MRCYVLIRCEYVKQRTRNIFCPMERAVKVFAVRAVQTYCTHHISLRVTSATYEYVIVYLACTDNCKLKADVISVLNPKQF